MKNSACVSTEETSQLEGFQMLVTGTWRGAAQAEKRLLTSDSGSWKPQLAKKVFIRLLLFLNHSARWPLRGGIWWQGIPGAYSYIKTRVCDRTSDRSSSVSIKNSCSKLIIGGNTFISSAGRLPALTTEGSFCGDRNPLKKKKIQQQKLLRSRTRLPFFQA